MTRRRQASGTSWPWGWFGSSPPPAPVGGVSLPGTKILEQQFPDLRMAVEIAWNGKQGTDPTLWNWTDVTHDVRASNKVTYTIGRADEASTTQPANCQFRLGNRAGFYSKGPQSPNYPNVTIGTPVRVRVILSGISYTRFFGYSVGFTPSWDVTGAESVVDVVAAGSLRRLQQGTTPLQSTLRRAVPTLSSLLAYWPCEDGTLATSFASAMTGGSPMAIRSGTAKPASYSGFSCSLPIPTLANDSWFGGVPAYVDTGSGQVRFLIAFPSAGTLADQARIISVATGGSISRIDIAYGTGGSLWLRIYDAFNNNIVNDNFGFNVDGVVMRMSVQWEPSGSDVIMHLNTYAVNAPGGAYVSPTVTGQNINGILSVWVAPDGTMSGAAIGHIYVQSTQDDIFNLSRQLNAFNGDKPTDRLSRLCSEQGETIAVTGSSVNTMGPQLPLTFTALLRECETRDLGVLYDGLTAGLSYVWREWKEDRASDLVLDASTGDIADPVKPYDDDQLIVNQFTASRTGGGSFTFTDTTDVLAVATVGNYGPSGTINCQFDSQLQDYAGWRVHMGTSNPDGYRYPALDLHFEEASNVLPGWLNLMLTDRVDVINLSQVRTQHANTTVSLLLEGYTETIDKFTWHVAANCSPYAPWRVGQFAADTGDTNPYVMHYDTDGASLVNSYAAGVTSLSVSTPSGPLWTTAADDFPFDVNIAGWQVTVTNVSGGSSPQTFTVNATPAPLTSGAAVSLWQPLVLSM